MANPYGIEQVDVPGILGAYDAARERRVQMLLAQNQLTQQNQQLDRETKLHAAYAKLRVPGADSGASAAVAAYGGPTPPATSASPAAVVAPMDPNSPTQALASETTPAAPPTPSAAPAAGHPLQGWLESNTGAIQDIMQQDPQAGMQAIAGFHQLDADKQQQLAAHLDLADKVNEHGIRLLAGVHDQASWDAARKDYAGFVQQFGLPAPNLPEQYDPQTVQGLQLHALSVKEQFEQMKPVALGSDSKLVNPQSGAVIAENPKNDWKTILVHNQDGSDTPYRVNEKTGETHQLTEGGAITGDSAAAPTGVGTSPKMAAVASTLSGAGFPAPVVAGFMGNFHVEGGYNGAHGDGGSASGIGQWHDDRVTNFQRVIGKPVNQASPADQAKFVVWEMQNPVAAGMTVSQRDAILAAKTPAQAAALIDQYYERSKGLARQERMAAATAFASGSGGAAPSAPSAPSAPAASGKPITGTTSGPLSDEAARFAAAVYKYKGTMPPQIGRTKGDIDKIMNLAAHMPMDEAKAVAEGTVQQWQTAHSAGQTLTAFEKGPQGNQVRSLNVAIQHIDMLRQAATALQNGNIPMFNAISQHIAQATGHAAPTNLDSLKNFVTDEVTKGVIGSAGGVQDREHAAQIVSRASSPAQLNGALDNFQGLLTGQAHGLQQQYEAGTGRHDFADKYLLPRTRELLLGQTGGSAGHGGSIPTLTPEQARAAPSGTVFRTTDGRTMRKH